MSGNIWSALARQAKQQGSLRQAFTDDPNRADKFSVTAGNIVLDYSKNLIDQTSWALLQDLAQQSSIKSTLARMLTGDKINITEQRAVWHMLLRKKDLTALTPEQSVVANDILDCRNKMAQLVKQLHAKEYLGYTGQAITDVIWIGVGGSLLGPQVAVEALTPYHCKHIKLHFVGNIDPVVVHDVLAKLTPATTLVCVASKSFGTEESIINGLMVKQWFTDHGANTAAISQHFWAATANIAAATEFGIAEQHILPLWDWVGGRFSVWSAIGLPVAIMVGNDQFNEFLAGAEAMDQHFIETPFASNMPVILALLGIWYVNGFGCQSQAILPYSHYLRLLPSYIQQLDMESNGKSIKLDGHNVSYATAPVIWGDAGTNGQHAYHQLLHQSGLIVPADFILPMQAQHQHSEQHQRLAAHCFAQTQALMQGKTFTEAYQECLSETNSPEQAAALAVHKVSAGNKPSNTLLLPTLSPYYLGSLIALYEHKTFCQGVIWQVNSFDQWGVELGKQLSKPILQALNGSSSQSLDCSTQGLIRRFLAATS
ncbi:glucose-6-phosphate isomerase [Rheinheimera sp. MMS21-TC3]|uniref:glucose-6-phosphate isomerase n=1 Tax=Rheinheimera sp. MMS21-TC3 TaxID=3072790 RepID=UPI0028C3CD1E|nr:glucose-6-phosphate isomerase [Rheinheimera sp. MMS21-TC3]WNO60561.1 glucose-6-phosphate isomerase [Rheinheimera sp. MMS21-TC3]